MNSDLTLNEFQSNIRDYEYYLGFENVSFSKTIDKLIEEVGELSDAVTHHEMVNESLSMRKDGVEEEIADVFIISCILVNKFNLNLSDIIYNKMLTYILRKDKK